jgi:hypothetical protein
MHFRKLIKKISISLVMCLCAQLAAPVTSFAAPIDSFTENKELMNTDEVTAKETAALKSENSVDITAVAEEELRISLLLIIAI